MLKANLKLSNNYKGADLDKLNKSLTLLEKAINGEIFRTAVLNFKSFQFTKYKCLLGIKTKTIHLKEYSNEEVYRALMNGHEQIGENNFMNLKLNLSEENGGSAIGETNNKDITTTYIDAFNRMTEGEFAAHLTHEWTHTLGFEHSFNSKCDSTRNS